jgi:hypothetical protein
MKDQTVDLTDEQLDRIDRFIYRVLRRKSFKRESSPGVDKLQNAGWSFTGTMGVFVDIENSRNSINEREEYILVNDRDVDHADAHRLLGGLFVSGLGSAPGPVPGSRSGLEHLEKLLDRTGRVFYKKGRLNGTRVLMVHPRLHEHLVAVMGPGPSPESRVQKSAAWNQKRNRKSFLGGNASGNDSCIVGKGKEGSFVFHPDASCFYRILPNLKSACLMQYSQQHHGGNCKSIRDLRDALGPRALLKINNDASDTSDELKANRRIHAWLSSRHLLHYTSLHRHWSYIHAEGQGPGARMYRFIVLKAFDGDVSSLPMSGTDAIALVKSILLVLHVIHEHRELHLDIKPKNILYRRVYQAQQGQAQQGQAQAQAKHFALSDYGILQPFREVSENLRQNLVSGTYGFISPLLLQSDADNGVFRIFKDVAQKSRGVYLTDQELTDMFARQRAQISGPGQETSPRWNKVDLHSLGLTLHALWPQIQWAQIQEATRAHLLKIMDGLLFFEPGHFWSAAQALRALVPTG